VPSFLSPQFSDSTAFPDILLVIYPLFCIIIIIQTPPNLQREGLLKAEEAEAVRKKAQADIKPLIGILD